MKSINPVAIALSSLAALLLISYSIFDSVARMRSAAVMAESATRFLASLSTEQKTKAVFSFEDEQRFDWHFIPRARRSKN
jgi:Protein of unknown function (DUF3500)